MVAKSHFVCQSCGGVHHKWTGQCYHCKSWNTIQEEEAVSTPSGSWAGGGGGSGSARLSRKRLEEELLSETEPHALQRHETGNAELDRVLGGGLVRGAAILLGGDPGIGKSTLLLQVLCHLSAERKILYVSGEEGLTQIRLRAQRLGLGQTPLPIVAATQIEDLVRHLRKTHPWLVAIDSIQTCYSGALEAAPGTVSQIRASAFELMRLAKEYQTILIFIGHVTKEGLIAGPRVLEHMVDTVLYFEGEKTNDFRLLRCVKNRFGATNEVGIFDMTPEGLKAVRNPSSPFLSQRGPSATHARANAGDKTGHETEDETEDETHTPGSCVFVVMEGTRPILLEIQALVSTSFYVTPKRSVVGWDTHRLSMILAVLHARAGFNFAGKDVYITIVGGMRVTEPAIDLAATLALLSSIHNQALPLDLVCFGEVGLTGEIRGASFTTQRLEQALKLGYRQAWIGGRIDKTREKPLESMQIKQLNAVQDLRSLFSPGGTARAAGRAAGKIGKAGSRTKA